MPDIRVVQTITPFEIALDWFLTPIGTLDERSELGTAVIVALGTDRLAEVDDVLPDIDSDDRRGWWGDLDAAEIWGGWVIGSRTWLLTRAKIVGPENIEGATLARAEAYVREALHPFVERRIVSEIDVLAMRTERDRIDVSAVLYRGPKVAVELVYQLMWEEQIVVDDRPTFYPPAIGQRQKPELHITSEPDIDVDENEVLAHQLTADRIVMEWSLSGEDASQFELSGSVLRWVGNGTKDFDNPDDASGDGNYVVVVHAVDARGKTADLLMNVLVNDVGD